MNDSTMGVAVVVLILLLAVLCFVVYLLPTIMASKRHHPQTVSIAVVNIFLGWSFIAWVAALAWSLSTFEGQQD